MDTISRFGKKHPKNRKKTNHLKNFFHKKSITP